MVFGPINPIADLRPRVAHPASRAWNSCKTALQIVVMWAILLVVLPLVIQRAEAWLGMPSFTGNRWIGACLFLVFSMTGLHTANVMVRDGAGTPLPLDTARNLVVSGAYRHVRNPMAIGGFGQGTAVGLWLGSLGVLCYVAVGAVVWQFVARPWEERDLEARFGDRYRKYRDAVPCWLPRLRPYVDRGPDAAPALSDEGMPPPSSR